MTCEFCSQPEGHTGVCGPPQPSTPPAKLVGRPRVAHIHGNTALIALFDDSTTRLYQLNHGRWLRGEELLEPLWQLEIKRDGAFETVKLIVAVSFAMLKLQGIMLNRYDAAEVLRKHPAPFGSDWSKADEAEWRDDDADLKAERAENAALKGE